VKAKRAAIGRRKHGTNEFRCFPVLCWFVGGEAHPMAIFVNEDLEDFEDDRFSVMLRKAPDAFFRAVHPITIIDVEGKKLPVIVVEEDMTDAAIRSAIPAALAMRDWLLKRQGAGTGGRFYLLEWLSDMQEKGTSYTQLARQMNAEIEQGIRRFLRIDDGHDEGIWDVEYRLEGVGFKSEEVDSIIETAKDNIRAGRRAFPPDFPMDRSRMIAVLRSWRAGRRHKALKRLGDKSAATGG
jgi:hypothetical protein